MKIAYRSIAFSECIIYRVNQHASLQLCVSHMERSEPPTNQVWPILIQILLPMRSV